MTTILIILTCSVSYFDNLINTRFQKSVLSLLGSRNENHLNIEMSSVSHFTITSRPLWTPSSRLFLSHLPYLSRPLFSRTPAPLFPPHTHEPLIRKTFQDYVSLSLSKFYPYPHLHPPALPPPTDTMNNSNIRKSTPESGSRNCKKIIFDEIIYEMNHILNCGYEVK